jgi:hypothetical protein
MVFFFGLAFTPFGVRVLCSPAGAGAWGVCGARLVLCAGREKRRKKEGGGQQPFLNLEGIGRARFRWVFGSISLGVWVSSARIGRGRVGRGWRGLAGRPSPCRGRGRGRGRGRKWKTHAVAVPGGRRVRAPACTNSLVDWLLAWLPTELPDSHGRLAATAVATHRHRCPRTLLVTML